MGYMDTICSVLWAGLGSNTYLYLQMQIQIRRISICIWSNFKPCICICISIWSPAFGVFDKYVFKQTVFLGPFSKQKFMKHKVEWIFPINRLISVNLFQKKKMQTFNCPSDQGWVQIHIRICICIQLHQYSYLYLYLKNTTLVYLYSYLYLNDVFERIWKIFFKYNSNFESISAELNNIGSVTWSFLPLKNWIMTHSYCDVKFRITAWIYNTNDRDELLTRTLFKFVLPWFMLAVSF